MDESLVEKLNKDEVVSVMRILPYSDTFFDTDENHSLYNNVVKPLKEKAEALLKEGKNREALQTFDELESITPRGSPDIIKKEGKYYATSEFFQCLHNIDVFLYTQITPEKYYPEVTRYLTELVEGELTSGDKAIVHDIAIKDFHRRLEYMDDIMTGPYGNVNKEMTFLFLQKCPTTAAIRELAEYDIKIKNIPHEYYDNESSIVKFDALE